MICSIWEKRHDPYHTKSNVDGFTPNLKRPMKLKGLYTNPLWLMFLIATAIFVTEWFAMLVLPLIFQTSPMALAVVNAAVDFAVAWPVLYLLLLRPMRLHIASV